MDVRPLLRQEVRDIDRRAAEECGLPTLVLMENAGRGAADWLRQQLHDVARKQIVIVCGPGNNGGDGGVVARHLDAWGFSVRVVWFANASELRGDAVVQWEILHRSAITQENWIGPDAGNQARLDELYARADWVIDGLLGTGLSRPVEGALHAVISAMNASGKPILALDLPSGLDANTGEPLGIGVHALATATFVAPKVGFQAAGANAYTGEVVVIDIGVPRCILAPYLRPGRL